MFFNQLAPIVLFPPISFQDLGGSLVFTLLMPAQNTHECEFSYGLPGKLKSQILSMKCAVTSVLLCFLLDSVCIKNSCRCDVPSQMSYNKCSWYKLNFLCMS